MAELGDWELETGLINDVDAYIKGPFFGLVREEYGAAIAPGQAAPLQAVFPLANEDGEIIGVQGYSVGTGWTASDDKQTITHPTRKNVVNSSLYGQVQNRVVKELGVNMAKYGLPTEAKSWDGLGFHWKLEDHTDIRGNIKQAPMPTEFLGELVFATAPVVAAGSPELDTELTKMAKSMPLKQFQQAALRVKGVSEDDTLLASILDDGEAGYYATHKEE